jgi:hypothetical protein
MKELDICKHRRVEPGVCLLPSATERRTSLRPDNAGAERGLLTL